MTTAHFGFTKLLVADLDKSAAFYESVFGLERSAEIESEIAGRPIREFMYKATGEGGGSFVLLTYTGTDRPASGEIIVGFITNDLPGIVDRTIANGGSVVAPPRDQSTYGVLVGFVADNEGHLIEVVQPVQSRS